MSGLSVRNNPPVRTANFSRRFSTDATPRGRAATSARGVTFLEVILSLALLGLAAGTMVSVIGYITNMQKREDALLASAELANRLVLQYLADPRALPPRGLPIGYHTDTYRWDISVTRIDLEPTQELELAVEQAGGSARARDTPMQVGNRLEKIVLTVWLSEESGGTYARDQGAPQYSLVRVADRLNFNRNVDFTRMMQNEGEAGLSEFISRVLGSSGMPEVTQQPTNPAGGAGGGTGGGNRGGSGRGR